MSLNEAPQTMKRLKQWSASNNALPRKLKSWQVWSRGAQMQNGGKPLQNRPSPAQFTSDSRLIPNFLGYSNSPWAGTNMRSWFYGSKPTFYEKVPAFLKSHTGGAKKKHKHEKNGFSVTLHFRTNRFTFEKFPPPPPLLHPTNSVHTA